jgi:hypothetical protein
MKTFAAKSIRFTSLSLFAAVGAATFAGCYSGETSEEVEAETGNVTQPIENAKDLLCAIVETIPSFSVGTFTIDKPKCDYEPAEKYHNDLYYFGPSRNELSTKPTCTGTFCGNYSKTIAAATYCAIADSSNTAEATFQSIVGRFGAQSEVRSFARNNQKRHIETEHLGKVVVFGLELPLQYSTTAWDFPKENQSGGSFPALRDEVKLLSLPGLFGSGKKVPFHTFTAYDQTLAPATGYYARAKTENLARWKIGGSGTFSVGPVPVELGVSLESKEGIASSHNARFADAPDADVKTSPTFKSFDEKLALCVDACEKSGGIFCTTTCGGAPTPAQRSGHELLCADGCNDNYFSNLTDKILPHSATSAGARGELLYRNDPVFNFWQNGYPGTEPIPGMNETKFGLISGTKGTSTNFQFDLTAGYDLGIAKIKVGTKLDFLTRAGASLRSQSRAGDLGSGDVASVAMHMDAETAINLNAWLDMTVNVGLIPFNFKFEYDIIDKKGNGHKSGLPEKGKTYSWFVKEQGNDAGTATCTAFQEPQTTTANPPTVNGWKFVEDVAAASIDNMHPCNVRICENIKNGIGTFTNYNWDKAGRKLVPQKTNSACTACESTAALCNAAGTVLNPTASSKSTNCGGTGNICGGRGACDAPEDCASGQASCSAGCCTVVQ